MSNKWELVHDDHNCNVTSLLERYKSLGGWIVRDTLTQFININGEEKERFLSSSLSFVSDPDHNWEINNEN